MAENSQNIFELTLTASFKKFKDSIKPEQLSTQDTAGRPLIFYAIKAKNYAITRFILDNTQVDLNSKITIYEADKKPGDFAWGSTIRTTLFAYAVRYSSSEIAGLLLRYSPDCDYPNPEYAMQIFEIGYGSPLQQALVVKKYDLAIEIMSQANYLGPYYDYFIIKPGHTINREINVVNFQFFPNSDNHKPRLILALADRYANIGRLDKAQEIYSYILRFCNNEDFKQQTIRHRAANLSLTNILTNFYRIRPAMYHAALKQGVPKLLFQASGLQIR